MQIVKIILSYDGTRFLGWKKTKQGSVPSSIQEELERGLAQILGHPVQCEGASRTDRGVHAKGQTVHFSTEKAIDPFRLRNGLNAVLPPELSVQSVELAPSSFHATLDATSKEYRYFLCTGRTQLPMHRLYSWHVRPPLHLPHIERAAASLIGTHDFSAFTNEKTDDAQRTLYSLEITPIEENRLSIQLRGNKFLYKMVRNLVGTLVYIGCNKLAHDSIPSLLASRDRRLAGITAPAHGLFLWNVFYNL